jgi:hypothetical protein
LPKWGRKEAVFQLLFFNLAFVQAVQSMNSSPAASPARIGNQTAPQTDIAVSRQTHKKNHEK